MTDHSADSPSVSPMPETLWPPRDVVQQLVDSAEHFLFFHDCDHDGYEKLIAARDAAVRWLEASSPPSVSPTFAPLVCEACREFIPPNTSVVLTPTGRMHFECHPSFAHKQAISPPSVSPQREPAKRYYGHLIVREDGRRYCRKCAATTFTQECLVADDAIDAKDRAPTVEPPPLASHATRFGEIEAELQMPDVALPTTETLMTEMRLTEMRLTEQEREKLIAALSYLGIGMIAEDVIAWVDARRLATQNERRRMTANSRARKTAKLLKSGTKRRTTDD